MAKKFKFYLDQKVTVWNRTSFEILAETEEEAKEIAGQFINRYGDNEVAECDDTSVEFINTETIYDTEEPMAVDENCGNATLELYINDTTPDNLVTDNTSI